MPGPILRLKIETLEIIQRDGYELRKEKVTHPEDPDNPTILFSAYTPEAHYIGDEKTAEYLITRIGIKPELREPGLTVCSIGFCEGEQKWYGWSHRAICGFGIGDRVEGKDHVLSGYFPAGFEAGNLEDARRMASAFAEAVS